MDAVLIEEIIQLALAVITNPNIIAGIREAYAAATSGTPLTDEQRAAYRAKLLASLQPVQDADAKAQAEIAAGGSAA